MLYVDAIQDYSAQSVDIFLETFQLNFVTKLYFLEVDAGSQLVALKQHTKVLGRLRSETHRNVSDAEQDDGRSEDDLLEEYI